MRRYGLWAALGLVLLANLLVLGGVSWNRSGQPDAQVQLSERELRLNGGGKENTGLHLRLVWQHNDEWQQEWFNKEKLEAVGYDCSRPVGAEASEQHYRKQLPRRAFAVLEFNGAAWQAWQEKQKRKLQELASVSGGSDAIQRNREQEMQQINRRMETETRLFVVDVGRNPDQLRQRYPDRQKYLVLPALVRLRHDYYRPNSSGAQKNERRLTGYIERLLVSHIHLPREVSSGMRAPGQQRNPLRSYKDDSYWSYDDSSLQGERLRYQVDLAVGSRYEPWVRSVQITFRPKAPQVR